VPQTSHARRLRRPAPLGPALLILFALLAPGRGEAAAQAERVQLFAGDSIRIDGTTIASVLAIDGNRLVAISRAKPRCRAGERHGEAPICDPAPAIRQDVDLREVTIEKRAPKGNVNRRTIVGGVLGGAAFATVGYLIGPSIGFGKVPGWECVEVTNPIGCPGGPVPRDEYERRQKAQDQKRGAFFFGVIGGSATAIFARKLSVGWVRIEPVVPVSPAETWGVTFSMPGLR
jgi:hypothetical protein